MSVVGVPPARTPAPARTISGSSSARARKPRDLLQGARGGELALVEADLKMQSSCRPCCHRQPFWPFRALRVSDEAQPWQMASASGPDKNLGPCWASWRVGWARLSRATYAKCPKGLYLFAVPIYPEIYPINLPHFQQHCTFRDFLIVGNNRSLLGKKPQIAKSRESPPPSNQSARAGMAVSSTSLTGRRRVL